MVRQVAAQPADEFRIVDRAADLHRRVPRNDPGTLDDRQVGEAQLVGRLDEPHAVLPHLQQNLSHTHGGRVLAKGHLWARRAKKNRLNTPKKPRGHQTTGCSSPNSNSAAVWGTTAIPGVQVIFTLIGGFSVGGTNQALPHKHHSYFINHFRLNLHPVKGCSSVRQREQASVPPLIRISTCMTYIRMEIYSSTCVVINCLRTY